MHGRNANNNVAKTELCKNGAKQATDTSTGVNAHKELLTGSSNAINQELKARRNVREEKRSIKSEIFTEGHQKQELSTYLMFRAAPDV